MLIDISQRNNIVAVSYADVTGDVKLKEFDVQAVNGYGVYDYEICEESDPEKHPTLRHFRDNLPIKRKPTWRFDFDEMREFLLKQIPKHDHDDIFGFNVPDLYMVDIEIDIEDGDVFPDPIEAKFPIDSIQITSKDLRTVTLTTNKRCLQDQQQIKSIEDKINEHYKGVDYVWQITDRLVYSHIVFDTETQMLEYFWKMVLEKLHAISFWNGERFDIPYLNNRCRILGVDMSLGSPTKEISNMHNWPKHRYVFDYMLIVAKWAWDLFPLISVSLDHVTKKIFGLGKVEYEGSYKDLYHGPIERFMVYGAVDVIGMQLMHLNKNYTAAKNSLVFYTKSSIFDASKVTAQVHALCWDELYAQGLINAEPFERQGKEQFEGGYVKQPVRKFVMYPVCVDFSALYPRVMQSFNMSFENFKGKIESQEHKKQLISEGYYVSSDGNYYLNDKDYTLRKIEDKLLDERYAYKALMMNVYLKGMGPLEAEIKKRGLKPRTIKSS